MKNAEITAVLNALLGCAQAERTLELVEESSVCDELVIQGFEGELEAAKSQLAEALDAFINRGKPKPSDPQKRFEKWAKRKAKGWSLDRLRNNRERYCVDVVQSMWEAFQEAEKGGGAS